MRRQHETHHRVGTPGDGAVDGAGNAGLPVAHPDVHRHAEHALERCAGLLGDDVERRRAVTVVDSQAR